MFSKYVFVVPLKDKKGITFVNAFQSILDNSKIKPNKISADQGSEFYNTQFRALKNKIYKHMAAISKNVYFNVLSDIADEYNNEYIPYNH